MWFRQLSFFLLDREKFPAEDILAEKLSQAAFSPVSGLERSSEGFTAAVPFSPEWVFGAGGTLGFTLKREDKILPAQVVREWVDDKVAKIQEEEARSVGRKERQNIKDEVTDELLVKAFSRHSHTRLIYEPKNGFLLVNQASANRAENALSLLREALGGLDARRPDTVTSPSALMTQWLAEGQAEGGFVLDEDCVLKSGSDDGSVVRFSRQDLTLGEVVNHIRNGKVVTDLGLVWQDKISFVLTQDFTFKRLKFLDILQEDASQEGEDPASLAAATQILTAENFSAMIGELVQHLGGRTDENR